MQGLPVKPGARVAKRTDKAAGFFVVTAAVNGKKVSIVPERGGPEEITAKADLVVVKRFGEPIYPALVPVDRLTQVPGKPYHTLINADNFHALQDLRMSELFGLKWQDIDFRKNEISVTRSIVFQVVGPCKTEASQKSVPLDSRLAAALKAWRKHTKYSKREDWVFASPTARGRRPYWAI